MQDGSTASWNDPACDEQRAALMQDDAEKTPETPRWEHRVEKPTGSAIDCVSNGLQAFYVCGPSLAAYLTHLEAALREAEEEGFMRGAASIQTRWRSRAEEAEAATRIWKERAAEEARRVATAGQAKMSAEAKLREAEAKAAGYKQSVVYALDRFGAIGSMSDWTESDLSDATQEARDAAGTLKRNVRLLEQPRAGEIR